MGRAQQWIKADKWGEGGGGGGGGQATSLCQIWHLSQWTSLTHPSFQGQEVFVRRKRKNRCVEELEEV
jgi:hypothetical protein